MILDVHNTSWLYDTFSWLFTTKSNGSQRIPWRSVELLHRRSFAELQLSSSKRSLAELYKFCQWKSDHFRFSFHRIDFHKLHKNAGQLRDFNWSKSRTFGHARHFLVIFPMKLPCFLTAFQATVGFSARASSRASTVWGSPSVSSTCLLLMQAYSCALVGLDYKILVVLKPPNEIVMFFFVPTKTVENPRTVKKKIQVTTIQ